VLIFVALFLAGLAIGAGLLFWHNRNLAHARRRVPKKWPLAVRPLVNSSEKRVWLWLGKAMFDQQVLVKLPVTRFTAPSNPKDAAHWFELLNSVYCTFTVCDVEGQVVGCVDVAGFLRSRSNQMLKHSVLSQCGLRYCVVDSTKLPHPTKFRFEFLGEEAARRTEDAVLDARFKDVKSKLQAALERQRNMKRKSAGQIGSAALAAQEFQESCLNSGWEQNSFVTPLDSRVAALRT
jgi:hypothetical protein